MENNDLLPYDYEPTPDNKGHSFGFVTAQKVRYKIRFKLTDYLFENVPELSWHTFEFIITPVFTPPGIKPKKMKGFRSPLHLSSTIFIKNFRTT